MSRYQTYGGREPCEVSASTVALNRADAVAARRREIATELRTLLAAPRTVQSRGRIRSLNAELRALYGGR